MSAALLVGTSAIGSGQTSGGTFCRLDARGEMAVQRTPALGEGIPMAGRHSKRPGVHVGIPGQRGMRPLGVIDARTHVEHLVSEQSAAAHRHAGCYVAECGAVVLAASLTEPGRGRCAECVW
jgi:hypothetical protein